MNYFLNSEVSSYVKTKWMNECVHVLVVKSEQMLIHLPGKGERENLPTEINRVNTQSGLLINK